VDSDAVAVHTARTGSSELVKPARTNPMTPAPDAIAIASDVRVSCAEGTAP
jgi:hypothetical protein